MHNCSTSQTIYHIYHDFTAKSNAAPETPAGISKLHFLSIKFTLTLKCTCDVGISFMLGYLDSFFIIRFTLCFSFIDYLVYQTLSRGSSQEPVNN